MLHRLDMTVRPDTGEVIGLEPGLRRIVAGNSSPMTQWGTNTYIVGSGDVIVIDPGPEDPRHRDAIVEATATETVTHIAVTHAHRDHSAGAKALSQVTGAPVLAFGPATAGRSEVMQELSRQGVVGGGEGVDHGFSPDRTLADGETIVAGDTRLKVIWTPGHFAGHLCFEWNGRIFTGDHVMGWASTLISPPDGDVTSFMTSCAKLKRLRADRFYPGHGAPVVDTDARLDWLMRHRRERETQILAALGNTPLRLRPLTRRIYHDASDALLPAAERNVLAHLVDLEERRLVRARPGISPRATFMRV